MDYEEALQFTKEKGSATLRWMLANGKAREEELPKTKTEKLERKRQLLKQAGIELEELR